MSQLVKIRWVMVLVCGGRIEVKKNLHFVFTACKLRQYSHKSGYDCKKVKISLTMKQKSI